MANILLEQLTAEIANNVRTALLEDVGSGDITAQLIPAQQTASAKVITREAAVISGVAWVNEVFHQVDSGVKVRWLVADGQRVQANQVLFELEGKARALLTGERTALNFLQSLSAVATRCQYFERVSRSAASRPSKSNLPALDASQPFNSYVCFTRSEFSTSQILFRMTLAAAPDRLFLI